MAASLDRAAFFAAARADLFGGSLSQAQVDGIERLIAAFTLYGSGDRRHLAYILATSYHETGRRMMPVREGFAATDAAARAAVAGLYAKGKISQNYALPNARGQSFYGRGDVQLTFEANYRRMGQVLGLDLVAFPDLVLEPATSARVIVEGMLRGISGRGDFSGKALEDYIDGDRCDYVQARRVVNILDKAAQIASYAGDFEHALVVAGMPRNAAVTDAVGKPIPVGPVETKPLAPIPVLPPPAVVAKPNLLKRISDWVDERFGARS
ncbi:glycoside hydrolase family 19 protein [Methylobacterium trifolii]|uniref:Glycoside hydrolase family 19 catalytic domain-containing protein n=1 Tax=Methylobacterium trifolii TaxID=1003092 RepID=A0ABQ4U4D3_9HYPH|nr:glycoside hydrolase family 19 protein [Methylobacterium trifolii]GJE61692.1 hypothetical protein MPOCJGCO_3815 [Methylobacterium trifolii]